SKPLFGAGFGVEGGFDSHALPPAPPGAGRERMGYGHRRFRGEERFPFRSLAPLGACASASSARSWPGAHGIRSSPLSRRRAIPFSVPRSARGVRFRQLRQELAGSAWDTVIAAFAAKSDSLFGPSLRSGRALPPAPPGAGRERMGYGHRRFRGEERFPFRSLAPLGACASASSARSWPGAHGIRSSPLSRRRAIPFSVPRSARGVRFRQLRQELAGSAWDTVIAAFAAKSDSLFGPSLRSGRALPPAPPGAGRERMGYGHRRFRAEERFPFRPL